MTKSLDLMVLSASGWRGVFAEDGKDESTAAGISREHKAIAAAAGVLFGDSIKLKILSKSAEAFGGAMRYAGSALAPSIIVGMDSRPTGPAIADAVIRALIARGCLVNFLGVVSAPEIMAYTRCAGMMSAPVNNPPGVSTTSVVAGFIYISASHNPIGHNGIKFGFTDGGVIPGSEAVKLTASIRETFSHDNAVDDMLAVIEKANETIVQSVYENAEKEKTLALTAYKAFAREVWTGANDDVYNAVTKGLKPAESTGSTIAIAADLNGSARTASIDRDFFASLDIPFKVLNGETGKIAHRIVPEGESLRPCCGFLEEARRENPAFTIGYVCDCDGDRGNLVVWDEKINGARPLGAQEVFALSVMAELAHLAWTNCGILPAKTGVVINDATSMRIDRIAAAFGARVFRAEVGEANVVSLARELRERGWTIRILGEGAAGGNITHPSAVRDPIATVMAIVKLLTIREGKAGGLYKIWCDVSGQKKLYRDNFTLVDIIESLPVFVTTSSYEKEAILNIDVDDHALLKARYQKIFEREWEEKRAELYEKYGIIAYEAQAYKGTLMFRPCRDFANAEKGGLRIVFFRDRRGSDNEQSAFAFIWMRGSGTEKAFRIMADVKGDNIAAEREFLKWQTGMIEEAV